MTAINLSEALPGQRGRAAGVRADQHAQLMRAVFGALRSCIHDHGPITADLIASAAKRVVGNLKNVPHPSALPTEFDREPISN